MQPIFVTGIGTGIGKTLVAAILAEALQADYWKPIQAGYSAGTDTDWVSHQLENGAGRVHPEKYRLALAASPHIAAREEGLIIDLNEIVSFFNRLEKGKGSQTENVEGKPQHPDKSRSGITDKLIVEGAGGLMVPLNDKEFVIDLIKKLDAPVVLVSRNYLGSINHSLMTARICQDSGIHILGWVFNDQFMAYEDEIVRWTGIAKLGSIPFHENPDQEFIRQQAKIIARNMGTKFESQ